jgi:FixJ family two-component response regulator
MGLDIRRDQTDNHFLAHRLSSFFNFHCEYEVFPLVVTGVLNKQIAYQLGTLEKTVEVHRARAMAKMSAQSIAGLVWLADKVGIASSLP